MTAATIVASGHRCRRIRARKGTTSTQRIGGGSQPVLTPEGWMLIYHGVEKKDAVGIYRSFWALLDKDDPSRILRQEDQVPLLEANSALTADIAHQMYLPTPVVFTTGVADSGVALVSQTVLLAGVNDDPEVLGSLMRGFSDICAS